jgi:hypothetical protein
MSRENACLIAEFIGNNNYKQGGNMLFIFTYDEVFKR